MVQISDTQSLGELIRSERRSQGLTQEELAGLSGVGITYLSNLERGKETSEVGKALNIVAMLGLDLFAQSRAQTLS